MLKGPSGSKRKADASEMVVPAKRSTHVVVPEEVEALLRTVASSLNAATLDLMNLPCADVSARGRVVAVVAECMRQLNNVLGIQRRGASVLAVSDLVIDVFRFVRRKELDALQIVSVRFNAIVEKKLSLVCLRMLNSAKISRCSAESQFVLVIDEVDSKKKTRLPTGVDDEAAATRLLLNACQSSYVGSLQLYGVMPMGARFLGFLALRAPTIFVNEFYMGNRTLSDGVADDKVLRALQSFAELKTVTSTAGHDTNLRNCLIRTCFKAGVTLSSTRDRTLIIGEKCNTAIVEDALMEFCFGACDEQYATRERRLKVTFSTLPKNNFLQRWIEKAEAQDCRHKLTLDITIWEGLLPQDTAALGAYKRNHQNEWGQWKPRFESVTGRHWTATYDKYDYYGEARERITFKINH